MTRKRKLAYAALLLNTVIWGAALPIVKPALAFISPYKYLFYRYLLAVPLSIPLLFYLLYKHKPRLKTILTIAALEFIGITAALSLLYEGLKRTTSLEASLIASASPVFIVIGGILFLHEKEERHEFIGLMLAAAGIVLLALEPLISGRNQLSTFSFTGNILVLGHNLFWTVYILIAKKVYKHISKLLIGTVSLWVGLISFFVFTLILDPGLSGSSSFLSGLTSDLSIPPVLFASLYMGILGSAVALPAYIYGNNIIEASEASLFFYLQPVIAIPLATLWLKEPINFVIIFAIILAATGVVIAERRKKTIAKQSQA